MNSKTIILIIVLYLNSTLIGMEIEPKHNLIQLLQQFAHNDVKQEIINHIKPKQWWYLDKVFKHNGRVYPTYSNSSEKLCAIARDGTARIFDRQTKKEIASFAHGVWIYSACLDPSEKLLTTASWDRKARIFDRETQKEIASFLHSDRVNSACLDPSGKLLATASNDGKVHIFAQYDDYTLEQLLFKKALLTWLLVEKPNKKIDTLDNLIKDVALKCTIPYEELIKIWSTFPEKMQNAIWRTMHYKIQKYGKDYNYVCIIHGCIIL